MSLIRRFKIPLSAPKGQHMLCVPFQKELPGPKWARGFSPEYWPSYRKGWLLEGKRLKPARRPYARMPSCRLKTICPT